MTRRSHSERWSARQSRQRTSGRLRARGLLWLVGVAVIAASLAVAALLYQFGYYVGAIIAAVLCALTLIPLGFVFGRTPEDRRDDIGINALLVITLIGVVIATATSLVGQEEVVLWGGTARNVVAAEAPSSGAAFLHFRNARVLRGRMERIPVYAGSQRAGVSVSFYLRVAPIVDADWTPGQPIGAFAVLGSPNFGHHNAEWQQPWNGGIILNGANRDERERALTYFRADRGLNVAPNPAFLRWSPDPEGEAAGAWARLWGALLIASGLWTVTLLVGSLFRSMRATPRD